jgi:hypothetical protein
LPFFLPDPDREEGGGWTPRSGGGRRPPGADGGWGQGKRRRRARASHPRAHLWLGRREGPDRQRRRTGGASLRWWLGVVARRGNGGAVVAWWCGEDGAGLFIAGARSVRGRFLCTPALRRGRLRRARAASRGGDRWQVNSCRRGGVVLWTRPSVQAASWPRGGGGDRSAQCGGAGGRDASRRGGRPVARRRGRQCGGVLGGGAVGVGARGPRGQRHQAPVGGARGPGVDG